MIACAAALLALSVLFFVLWQYIARPWLLVIYIAAQLTVCIAYFLIERRRREHMLDRFEHILQASGKESDISDEERTLRRTECIVDESLTPGERRLITHLCELETREEKVRSGYLSISSLVADIAHQAKTPLSSILMYTELGEHGDVVREQTEKLSFLMDFLVKLSKCEGGLIAENLSPTEGSVRELVRRSLEAVYASADAKDIELCCDVSGELTAVFDLRWTAEAVGNILDNAIKYSPSGSRVTVTAYRYELFVRLDIADCGGGIPEDELCSIWKRFYRGRNSRDASGVGIGLYLTASILNTEGGRVSVSSNEEGSVFSVFLSRM